MLDLCSYFDYLILYSSGGVMKLSDCVFCGYNDTDWMMEILPGDDRETFKVTCQKCNYELAGFDRKSEAIDEWNGMEKTADSRLFFE